MQKAAVPVRGQHPATGAARGGVAGPDRAMLRWSGSSTATRTLANIVINGALQLLVDVLGEAGWTCAVSSGDGGAAAWGERGG